MNEVKRILNFWKEVNLLTPVTVKSSAFKNQESLSTKEVLKVPYNRIEDSLLLNNDEKYEIHQNLKDITINESAGTFEFKNAPMFINLVTFSGEKFKDQ